VVVELRVVAVAEVAELVVLDVRAEVVVALEAAAREALAAMSIARPITPNAAKLRIVATTRARAAACGRRAIGQPPTGPVCGTGTPVVTPTLVPVVPGCAATPLPEVPVCGGVVPMPVPGCAGVTPPCCGIVPHCPSSGPSSPHCPEIGFVGVALGSCADWYVSCGLAADRAPIAHPIPRNASAPAIPAAACVVLLVLRCLGGGGADIVGSLGGRV